MAGYFSLGGFVSFDWPTSTASASNVSTPSPTPVAAPTPTPAVTPTPVAAATPAPTQTVPGFYVSVNGNDSTGNGTVADPFATLARAQQAMENSSIHTTYVEGGTYNLTSALNLTSADDGMAFIAAPGLTTPILNGGAAGLTNLITLNGADNVTLQGLTFDNTGSGWAAGAVALTNSTGDQIIANDFNNNDTGVYLFGSNNNLISGNEIDSTVTWGIDVSNGSSNNIIDSNGFNGTTLKGTGASTAAIALINGGSGNAVTHNAINDVAGAAIEVMTWFPGSSSDYNTSDTIAYNSIKNADSATSGFTGEGSSQDSGAIYLASTVGNNENILIDHNYIETLTDPANPTNGQFMLDVGVYLDDFASGVTVTNNIVQGGNLGFLVHGANDTFTNNVFDVGTNSGSAVGFFQYENTNFNGSPAPVGQTNDTASGNIINSTANGPANAWVISGVAANISGNLYYNTNGQPINTSGDSNPSNGDPQFANAAGGDFSLSSGSAASAIGFQNINQSNFSLAPQTATWW